MGLSSSKATEVPTGKKIVAAKFETSSKTGVLNLSGQNLKSSSKSWSNLSSPAMIEKIRSVDVSGNSLESLPVEIFQLVNMKTLKASKCSLNILYDLSMCTKLSMLKVDYNQLSADNVMALPPALGQCNMSSNLFDRVPPAVLCLTAVIELNLDNNQIATLTGIGSLTSLQVLSLDENTLQEIPVECSLMVKLRRLSIMNNRISKLAVTFDGQSIHADVFKHTALESLNLTGNTDLRNADVFKFEGIDMYLERRKKVQDKALSGGALSDSSLFGLE